MCFNARHEKLQYRDGNDKSVLLSRTEHAVLFGRYRCPCGLALDPDRQPRGNTLTLKVTA